MDGPPPLRGGTFNPFEEASCPDLHSAWEEGFQARLAGEPVPEKHRESPSAISNAWLNGYTAAQLSGRPSAEQGPFEAGGPAEPRQGGPRSQDTREAPTDASTGPTSGLRVAKGSLAEGSLAEGSPAEGSTAEGVLEVSVTDTAAAEVLPDGASLLDTLTPVEQEGARYGYRQAGRPFGPTRRGLEIWLRLRARARAG